MKIALAQMRSAAGDVAANLARHQRFVEAAAEQGAEVVVFPELSLTGYEPELAERSATTVDDPRFDGLQALADRRRITIAAGMPTRSDYGVRISMLIFRPGTAEKPAARQVYSKQYIHADEEPFFVRGEAADVTFGGATDTTPKIAPAICYELSVPEHAKQAAWNGAEIYLASVAKTASGVERAYETLAASAAKHSMTVLMVNCVGPCGGFESAGRSAAWNRQGVLLGQLGDSEEAILLIDTAIEQVTTTRM